MSGYTFYFSRADNGVPAFDFAECADDAEAMRTAQGLLVTHTTADNVEVFNGEHVVGVATRSESRIGKALRTLSVKSNGDRQEAGAGA